MVSGRGTLRRSALAVAAALALGLPAAPCAAQTSAAPSSVADGRTILAMVRSSLAALDQANKTGNYTVLRDLGGASFRRNTDARLAEVFGPLRAQAVDLSPALTTEPVYTLPARLEPSGLLRCAGFIPSQPRLVFEIAWQREDGAWKLYGVVVTTTQGPAPAAVAR